MKKLGIAFLYYAVFWLVFFIVARLFFIVFQFNASSAESIGGLAGTFINGIRLDVSTTGYYLILPMFLAVPGLFIKGRWFRIFMRLYSYVLIVFSSLIIVADANLYTFWGYRMDYTPLFYLRTPREAMASVSASRIIFFVLAIAAFSSLFIFFFNRTIIRHFKDLNVRHRFAVSFVWLILWAALIIPIRGGFGVAPINAGSVYFSSRMFLNHASVNAVWNVGTSAFTGKPVENPYLFSTQEEAIAGFDSLKPKPGNSLKVLNTERPNILMIVLESFSGYLIGPLGGDSLVTPCFNRFARQGILFSEFYASGTRTDKAMPAILDGYPAQPAQSIIKEPKKTQSLPSLVRILNDAGYYSSFWYGGEINFANFNSFVIGSGFRNIITKDYFDPKDYNSKWGVHDHIMFKALQDSMKEIREPFFNVVLTLSSHEPFDVPEKAVFAGDDNLTKYKNSVHYTDHSLGEFISWAERQDWWQRTLVIMVADHGAWEKRDIPFYNKEFFRIPMLWTGGALKTKEINISKVSSQTDIPATLLGQLGLKGDFQFSKDILSEGSGSFAFYTFNEGFGFVTDSSHVAWDHKVKEVVVETGIHPEIAEKYGKAYLQVLFDDYLKR